MKHLYTPLALAISTALLVACGGGSSTNNTKIDNNPNKTPIKPQPTKALSETSLKPAGSAKAFADYMSQALKPSNSPNKEHLAMADQAMPEAEASAPVAKASSKPSSAGATAPKDPNLVSSTNLIEQGVDELDFVKQNQDYIFTTSTFDKDIKIFAKPNTSAIAKLELPQFVNFKGLYLKQNTLFSLQQESYRGFYGDDPIKEEAKKNDNEINHGVISLNVIDVNDPKQPTIGKVYTWQGDYQNSKRIGDNLYVVSQTNLQKPNYCPMIRYTSIAPRPDTMPACDQPQDKLTPELIAQRMPKDINGKQIDVSSCYIPNNYNNDKNQINSNITLITKVDLSGGDNHSTTCVASSVDNVYMSPQSLYLTNTDYKVNKDEKYGYQMFTNISKFNLADEVKYAGTGTVKGQLSHSNKDFSMSEHKGVLRVVSVSYDHQNKDNRITNMLHTLKESDKSLSLETLATIPNKEQPQTIGKPNEDIKGVRFLGDEAYVVTFERIDPLYKIDLSNPKAPKVVGELEMPGYSTYLHRINDKYLMGVGYSVKVLTDHGRRVINNGIQTTIFDTSQKDPVIVDQDTVVLKKDAKDHSYFRLPLEYDSRAITTLQDDKYLRVAIPYKLQKGGYKDGQTFSNKALEYNINLTTGKIDKQLNRKVSDPISIEPYPYDKEKQMSDYERKLLQDERNYAYNMFSYSGQRALIDNDDLYYNMFDGGLMKYQWLQ